MPMAARRKQEKEGAKLHRRRRLLSPVFPSWLQQHASRAENTANLCSHSGILAQANAMAISSSLMKPANTTGKLKKADAKLSHRNRRFTPVTRQLCLQHHAGGYGYKKISKVTGIPISTIKYHVRKERRGSGGAHESSGVDAYDDGASSTVAPATAVLPAVLSTRSVSPLLKQKQTRSFTFEKSAALIEMMHAVHEVVKKNVYAFARALQHDPHGAPGLMNAAEPQMLTLALNLLLQDQWAERQELAVLGRILLQRLHNARDFLRSAISLCQRAFPVTNTAAPAFASAKSPRTKTTYWECSVCAKRLVHTGKCAHQMRCLKKCKVLLTHEQLQAAKAKAAAAVAQSESPEEFKHQLKHVFTLKKFDDKRHQMRYMQLVVAANTSLQQDIDAAPAAILESREVWRVVQSGPNPVVAALALVSLALALQPGQDTHSRKKKAFVYKYAQELGGKVAEQIASVEAFLKRCVVDASSPTAVDAHDVHEHIMQQQHHHHGCEELQSAMPAPTTCTCYRVRISALIS